MTAADAFKRILEVLDRLEIHYMVTGSGASSVHGMWRATGDLDLVVRIHDEDVKPLLLELASDFYADIDEARAAVKRGRAFNLIHRQSAFKFDLFPISDSAFDREQFTRRRFERAPLLSTEPIEFAVATAEDAILAKLRWYRLGGEVSEQQWNDVLGVAAVQRGQLDMEYLNRWAGRLGLADLLSKALAEGHAESERS